MNRPRDLWAAVLGAAVTVIGIQLPLSPLFGGAVAAIVRPDPSDEGVRIGALAGILATVGLFALGSLNAPALAIPEARGMVNSIYFGLLVLVVVVYVIILSALGGFLGLVFRRFLRRRVATRR